MSEGRHRKPRKQLKIRSPRLILEPEWGARWPAIGCGQVLWWALEHTALVLGCLIISARFIWLFHRPEVHLLEWLSWDPREEEKKKRQPRHSTDALTLPALLKGDIWYDISKATMFSWRNFMTSKTLMTACVRKWPSLSFRPDVNLLVTLPC